MSDFTGEQRLTQKEAFALAKKLSTADQFWLLRDLLDYLCPEGKEDLEEYQKESIRSLKKFSLKFIPSDEREAAELALLQGQLKQFNV